MSFTCGLGDARVGIAAPTPRTALPALLALHVAALPPDVSIDRRIAPARAGAIASRSGLIGLNGWRGGNRSGKPSRSASHMTWR